MGCGDWEHSEGRIAIQPVDYRSTYARSNCLVSRRHDPT